MYLFGYLINFFIVIMITIMMMMMIIIIIITIIIIIVIIIRKISACNPLLNIWCKPYLNPNNISTLTLSLNLIQSRDLILIVNLTLFVTIKFKIRGVRAEILPEICISSQLTFILPLQY